MTFQPVNYWLVHMYIPCFVASVTEFLLKRRRDFAAAPSLPYGIIKMTFCLNPWTESQFIYTYHELVRWLQNSVNFLKMDDLVSQSVTVLNLGRDIRSTLLRNGLDKVESLLIHDAPTIQQMTRLGPKRMQRLEAALKDFAPQLGFGKYIWRIKGIENLDTFILRAIGYSLLILKSLNLSPIMIVW